MRLPGEDGKDNNERYERREGRWVGGKEDQAKDICPLLSSWQSWAVWSPSLSPSPIASGLLTVPSLEGPSCIMAAVSSESSPRLQVPLRFLFPSSFLEVLVEKLAKT